MEKMAKPLLRSLSVASPLFFKLSPSPSLYLVRSILAGKGSSFHLWKRRWSEGEALWGLRRLSHGSVRVVISEGKAKFETDEVEPPKKYKWLSKKRLKLQRLKEKQRRKLASKTDPRRLGKKKKKQKFANVGERIKYKIEKAKNKEALLIERLRRYEVPKVHGPIVEPVTLTGEERFFIKKMGQKRSNYVPIGRRGVFGGVILNMHMHWKKHETVKVIFNACKPGEIHDFVQEIARLSGGVPIQIIGDDRVIFYRGKDYVQPQIMYPIDTLSKKKALEKSKYEQSLDSVRQFIVVAEKELELYNRHIALYGCPNETSNVVFSARESEKETELCDTDDEDSDLYENQALSTSESDSEEDTHFDHDSDYGESSSNSKCVPPRIKDSFSTPH